MKYIFLMLTLLSFNAFATDVDGSLTYKLPNGDLVSRDVVFNVPARGQGEVVLSGKSFEWKSKKFKSFTVGGKTTFVVIFDAEFRGMKSQTMLKGTYLKGKNKIIYTGDMFKTKKGKKFKHAGVFNFEFDR